MPLIMETGKMPAACAAPALNLRQAKSPTTNVASILHQKEKSQEPQRARMTPIDPNLRPPETKLTAECQDDFAGEPVDRENESMLPGQIQTHNRC
jgi:hypothetical protein